MIPAVGARLALAAVGEMLELTGELEQSKYGPQFRVFVQRSLGVQTSRHAARWLQRLDGVGYAIAQRLVNTLGDRLVDALASGDEITLASVHGVSPQKAARIVESFRAIGSSELLEDLQYLDGIGCTQWMANQVAKYAKAIGKTARKILECEPYTLLQVKGLGWSKVDHLARVTGTSELAPARLDAGTLHVLDRQVDQGSTMIRLGHLARVGAEELGVESRYVVEAVQRLAESQRVIRTQAEDVEWIHPMRLYRAERDIYQAARADLGNAQGVTVAPPSDSGVRDADTTTPIQAKKADGLSATQTTIKQSAEVAPLSEVFNTWSGDLNELLDQAAERTANNEVEW